MKKIHEFFSFVVSLIIASILLTLAALAVVVLLMGTGCKKDWPELTPEVENIIELPVSEVIISVYHGATVDTVGLAIANIERYRDAGTYFISGDFNGWTKQSLEKTRSINGNTYLLWPISHQAPKLEKFNFGKQLLAGGESWNYSPASAYWHVNDYGGELWVYFENGIYPDTSSIFWTADEVVINIYHGLFSDTVGLAISHINYHESQGTYFVSGDFNSWAEQPLEKIRVINGRTYLLWAVNNHAVGLEKFGFGKKLLDGSESWNYSPESLFWHDNLLWGYFTSTGISYLPEDSN